MGVTSRAPATAPYAAWERRHERGVDQHRRRPEDGLAVASGSQPDRPGRKLTATMADMRTPLFVGVVLQTALSSQTFIVDAANGPGTNFTSLPAAAAAVPDGAVLIVRPGSYAGFAITQKGLAVLADPGVIVTSTIQVSNNLSHQAFVLRDVSWPVPPLAVPCVSVANCAGPVLLEELTTGIWPAGGPNTADYWPLQAHSCGQLALRSCSLFGSVNLQGCVAALENCTLQGHCADLLSGCGGFLSTSPGIDVLFGTTLQVVSSNVRGGNGFGSGPAGSIAASHGISCIASDVRVLASVISGGIDGSGQRAAIHGSSSATAWIDNLSVLNGGLLPWFSAHHLAMPHLVATGAPGGGTLTATNRTQNGDLVVLIIDFPACRWSCPGSGMSSGSTLQLTSSTRSECSSKAQRSAAPWLSRPHLGSPVFTSCGTRPASAPSPVSKTRTPQSA